MELVVKVAGFSEVDAYGDYSNEQAAADHGEIVFVARR